MERTFTLDEANSLLPQLRELLPRMREARDAVAGEARAAGAAAASNGSASAAARGSGAQARLAELAHDIEAMGVVLRDIDSGLVDFPSTRDGEPVYLCWRLGEESVGHWHPRDSGYAGREPL